jgi:hypothetical protein
MAGSPVVQLRIPGETLAAIDAARGPDSRTAWVLALIERGLADSDTALRLPWRPSWL